MAKVTGLNHITLATQDLRQSLYFYSELLGFETVATWDTGVYLLAGCCWLCLSYDPDTKQQACAEYTHIAFTVITEEFLQLQANILAHNIPVWKENKSEGQSLYILDPSHNKLELHAADLKSRIQHCLNKPYANMQFNHKIIASL